MPEKAAAQGNEQAINGQAIRQQPANQQEMPEAPTRARPTQDLGRRIREARLARNMTQSELADGIFSMSYISAVERGQIRPSLGALERLAQALQVPADELLRNQGGEAPAPRVRAEAPSWMTSEEADYRLHEALLLALSGTPQQARDALTHLANRRLSSRQRARLQWQVAMVDRMEGHSDDARRAAEEGLEAASRLPDAALRVRLRIQLGQAMEELGNPQAAMDQFRNALGELEAIRSEGRTIDPALQFEVLLALAGVEMTLKRTDAAIDHLEQATRLAEDALRPAHLAQAYRALSETHFQQGDLSGAEEYALRGVAAYETAARRRQDVLAIQRLATAYVGAGRPAEAISHLLAGIKAAEQQGDVTSQAALEAGLARAYLDQGKRDDARAAAQRAVAAAQQTSDKQVQAQVHLAQARVQDASGDLSGEEHSLDQAIALLREGPATSELSDAYAQLSSLLERQGKPQRALEVLKQALRLRESGSASR